MLAPAGTPTRIMRGEYSRPGRATDGTDLPDSRLFCQRRSFDRLTRRRFMCDYSLEHVASRPAAVADRLILTSFPHTITRGFTAVGDINTAVCLRPGTELAFEQPVVYEHPVTHVQVTVQETTARFRRVDTHVPHAHHDSLEFADGTTVPLTRLLPGQHATVLQLPSVPLAERAEEAAEHSETRPADFLV
jgi:hypothetical protein